jgi:hypothetical protein
MIRLQGSKIPTILSYSRTLTFPVFRDPEVGDERRRGSIFSMGAREPPMFLLQIQCALKDTIYSFLVARRILNEDAVEHDERERFSFLKLQSLKSAAVYLGRKGVFHRMQ